MDDEYTRARKQLPADLHSAKVQELVTCCLPLTSRSRLSLTCTAPGGARTTRGTTLRFSPPAARPPEPPPPPPVEPPTRAAGNDGALGAPGSETRAPNGRQST